jgi:hypothetical protein
MTFPWWFWFFPAGIFLTIAAVPLVGWLSTRRTKKSDFLE